MSEGDQQRQLHGQGIPGLQNESAGAVGASYGSSGINGSNGINGSSGINGPSPASVDISKIVSESDGSVSGISKNLFDQAVLGNPYFAAGGGLMFLGGALALMKSSITRGAGFAYRQMIVDLEISSKDRSYNWFLAWMSQFEGRMSRHLAVETNYAQRKNGSVETDFSLVPGPGNHLLKYKGAYMFVKRERSGKLLDMHSGSPFETVTLTTLYRDRNLFKEILNESKRLALKASEGKTVIYTPWNKDWLPFGQPRSKRLIDSVVLDKGIKEQILEDVKSFLKNGKWYHERGIPYRRGYLLYGPPGSGKTSFIQALAGELDYDICLLNLSEANLTDDRLNYIINHIPARSILLLEDIDAAFNQRAATSEQGYTSKVTFSGLLNALDGVTSAEEIMTFMTTNHPEKLDPALLRPGRVDFKVLIDNASEYQVQQLFMRFYPGEIEKCNEFMKKYRALHLETPISTAALQGLFVYNKHNPDGAVKMIEVLTDPNHSF
ncbi:hypothetical protein PACTADRAFT_51001 [Pachysolen tannophilus NRRL Y-2460]|uniref:AAA+ ATPase domain-containing protein n=1 Tax=Pachysolen tannophilus NRRL Y-2460 TaxID=669874 RepID=A0A1E4TQS2_PACTA|nr:hypothetical protein PACTADRAFT_51001 [Pachysolen tannophilus NRRL Y-2460]